MTAQSTSQRRQEVIARLKAARDGFQKCIEDVTAEASSKGTEWSIADLLRHSTGVYQPLITRLLEENSPDLSGRYDPEIGWSRAKESLMNDIDKNISAANDMPDDQLEKSGQRNGETIDVLNVLTLMANHYDEHLAQLRNEVRIREGLKQV